MEVNADADKPLPIEVLPAAPDQEHVLANLLELYMHDFSQFVDVELGPDGRFGYQGLAQYWHLPGRHPFVVSFDGKLAGLILVRQGSQISGDEDVWDMAEFFIIRKFRRRGVGTEAASLIWRRFPGKWEVRVVESNLPAIRFWEHAIASFRGRPVKSMRIEKNGAGRLVFPFESTRVE